MTRGGYILRDRECAGCHEHTIRVFLGRKLAVHNVTTIRLIAGLRKFYEMRHLPSARRLGAIQRQKYGDQKTSSINCEKN